MFDDGSPQPAAIAEVAGRHGARLLRLERNGGPAVARNAGLAAIDTELVAFLDSDCVPSADWAQLLAAHLADPLVGAVAPRIVPRSTDTPARRYAQGNGSLDLGPVEGRVEPLTAVSYAPTAALVVRQAALRSVAIDGVVFDPTLRYGEDVDVVWRLHTRGWRIRYDPRVAVGHDEPATWPALLTRRFHYGTSAAPLARRHPRFSVPLVVTPWPAAAVLLFAARRPMLAGAGLVGATVSLRRALAAARIPSEHLTRDVAQMTAATWLGVGRYLAQFGIPVIGGTWLARAALGRAFRLRPSSRSGRAVRLVPGALALVLAPGVVDWRRRRQPENPIVIVLGHLADDVAYGCGVWAGCLRHRTIVALRPRLTRRLVASHPQPASPVDREAF